MRVRVRLRDRYPTASRMTRWRIRKQPGFPDGTEILGTEYFYEDELEEFETTGRCSGQQSPPEAASAAKAEAEPLVSDRTISVEKSEKHSKAKPHRTLAAGIPAAKADA
jgi:hypothetical protein